MRWFVLMAALLCGVHSAQACPPLDACVVRLPSTIEAPATTEAPAPVMRVLQVPAPVRVKLAPGEVEMPWIWQALRDRVHSQLPQYHERDRALTIVLSPVVVTSPSDTVPGVGISGDF